jgi:hypothetical protein
LQSPKGPQKIPSIIRLYPNFDAPAKDAASRGTGSGEPVRSAYGLPTVEELDALLARIHAVEADVSMELQAKVNADIARLKRQVAELEGDAFESAFRELDRALSARKALGAQIREQAFAHVDADATFGPRKYLRLISREPKG